MNKRIKLECKQCHYSYEVIEYEFIENTFMHKYCYLRCGGENEIINLEEVLTTDIETTIKNNIIKWGRELGIEGCIELIERNNTYAIQRLYLQELKRKGWIK